MNPEEIDPMAARGTEILFVCTGNTCRSPMAAAIFRFMADRAPARNLRISSAGTDAGTGPATDHAIEVARERGLRLECHQSRPITRDLLDHADLVLAMTKAHKDRVLALDPAATAKVFTLGEYSGTGGEIPDPIRGEIEAYRRCADVLEEELRRVLERFP